MIYAVKPTFSLLPVSRSTGRVRTGGENGMTVNQRACLFPGRERQESGSRVGEECEWRVSELREAELKNQILKNGRKQSESESGNEPFLDRQTKRQQNTLSHRQHQQNNEN